MKYLIFEYQYQGHYLEYVRHILTYASKHLPEDEIYLALPEAFDRHVKNGELPHSSKFKYCYFTDDELASFQSTGKFAQFNQSYNLCKKLSALIKQYSIDRTILITAIPFILAMCIVLPRKAYVSAIEYIIPRRRLDCASSYKRCEDRFRMWLYAHTPQLKRLFLLNDEESAEYYNRKFHTDKFKFLPDPVDCVVEKTEAGKDNKIVLLHAGRFRREKGTFIIIEGLKKLTPQEREQFKFILCGGSSVKEDEENAVKSMSELGKIMDVEFYNGFVKEEFLHELYNRADYVMIPYSVYYSSSGNLGHAASYEKPVIGPAQGLLGHLIEKYNLGLTLEALDSDCIARVLRKVLEGQHSKHGFKEYAERCSPSQFSNILMT